MAPSWLRLRRMVYRLEPLPQPAEVRLEYVAVDRQHEGRGAVAEDSLQSADALAVALTKTEFYYVNRPELGVRLVVSPSIDDGAGLVMDELAVGTLFFAGARFGSFEENAGKTNSSTVRPGTNGPRVPKDPRRSEGLRWNERSGRRRTHLVPREDWEVRALPDEEQSRLAELPRERS